MLNRRGKRKKGAAQTPNHQSKKLIMSPHPNKSFVKGRNKVKFGKYLSKDSGVTRKDSGQHAAIGALPTLLNIVDVQRELHFSEIAIAICPEELDFC